MSTAKNIWLYLVHLVLQFIVHWTMAVVLKVARTYSTMHTAMLYIFWVLLTFGLLFWAFKSIIF